MILQYPVSNSVSAGDVVHYKSPVSIPSIQQYHKKQKKLESDYKLQIFPKVNAEYKLQVNDSPAELMPEHHS